MNSRKFYINIIIRVILITISIALAALFIGNNNYIYTISTLVILSALQTYLLIKYIVSQRQLMSRMLSYIRDYNPTMYFSQKHETPFRELGDFLNEIGAIVSDVRIDKESQLQYMDHITTNVPVGLLAFDQDGKVEFFNPECKRITGINNITIINDVERAIPGILKLVKDSAGQEPGVLDIHNGRLDMRLSVKSSVFKMGNRKMTVVSLQDIGAELDQKEIEAWQKLIRVLTHEIINSVTPITSLSAALSGLLSENDKDIITQTDKKTEKIITGLGYIEERGRGLIDFVNRYRSLTRIPEPRMAEANLPEMLNKIAALKEREAQEAHLTIKTEVNLVSPTVFCDPSLTEHVIINLVNNAIESYEKYEKASKREILIIAQGTDRGNKSVSVRDFGRGINEEIAGDIFIPFFTTRQNGSGIGLSISRQIMKLQGGTLILAPATGEGAMFTLNLPPERPARSDY